MSGVALDLADRSAIVTGGAGGLGSATVRNLVQCGMRVVVFDVNVDGGQALAKELGDKAIAVVGDSTDSEDVAAAIDTASSLGPLTLIVNVAGGGAQDGRTIHRDRTPHDLGAFIKTMEVNVIGTFNMTRLAAARMADNEPDSNGQRGVVVNTSSIAAMDGQTGTVGYVGAKAAILGMTLPLAVPDLGVFGIRVCAISPGTMATPAALRTSDKFREGLLRNVAFPTRMGQPEEFALLVEQIARNPYLNGENIRLDAGLRLPPK